jgi:hypothetical protein
MSSPEVFAKRMGAIAVVVEGNVEKAMRKAALAIDSAVVSATPVDTGRARSNWLPNFDAPASGTVAATSAAGATALVAGKVASFDLTKNKSIHITNNLPYIRKLNEGSSSQAPAGFVRRAIFAGVGAIKSIKLLRK